MRTLGLRHKKDNQLVALFMSSTNEEVFAEIVRRYSSTIYVVAHRIVRNEQDAEDIRQDVLIKMMEKLRVGKYAETESFPGWVSCLTRNVAIDLLRSKKRVVMVHIFESENPNELEELTGFFEKSTEDTIIERDAVRKLYTAVNLLPEEQQKMIYLRYAEELSFKEISKTNNEPINTSRGRAHKACKNLRKILKTNPGLSYA